MLNDAHLTELITKFYNISNLRYNGKVYDNVLNIFDELDLDEQKTLIRGTLGTYAAATSALIHERDVIDRGDTKALLEYLKRQHQRLESDARAANQKEEEKSPPPKEDKSQDSFKEFFDSPTGGALKIALLSLIFFVLVHICILAWNDDPDSIQGAKVYKNLIEIVEVFVAK